MAGSSHVSPVVSINGQDVVEYLESIAATITSQDPDASWNDLFASAWGHAAHPDDALLYRGQFAVPGWWPGTNNTHLEFKNGSSIDLPTYAVYHLNDFPDTGEDMFKLLCIEPLASNSSTSSNSRRDLSRKVLGKRGTQNYTSGPQFYPTPLLRDPQNLIIGFNLDAQTDVMFLPTFEADANGQTSTLSDMATKIVQNAVDHGRTKMIIDVSANGGGNIDRAFDLFKLFFPSKFPYSATRFRRHDASEIITLALRNNNGSDDTSSAFYWQDMVNPLQEHGFKSVQDYLDGGIQYGTNVTSLFANFNYTLNDLNGQVYVRGFGDPLNGTQPFKAEDILIITDGHCASTCTTFVNLMTNVGGVRAVAFGGRPRLEPVSCPSCSYSVA